MGRVAALIKEREGGKGEGGVGRGGGTENGMAWGLVEAKEGRERFDRRCSREVPGVQLAHKLLRLLCRRAPPPPTCDNGLHANGRMATGCFDLGGGASRLMGDLYLHMCGLRNPCLSCCQCFYALTSTEFYVDQMVNRVSKEWSRVSFEF